jgi:hypothetical protein
LIVIEAGSGDIDFGKDEWMRGLRAALVVTGTAILLTLVGCAPSAPATEASPSRTATPSSTPTPSQSKAVGRVALSGSGVAIVSADGAPISSFEWSDDPDPFLDELEDLLKIAPVRVTENSYVEGGPADVTTSTWDGLTITTVTSTLPCEGQACRTSYAEITAAELNGVSLGTASGIQVGMTIQESEELGARPTAELALASDPVNAEHFPSGGEATRVVALDSDASGSTIAQLVAPRTTYGNL